MRVAIIVACLACWGCTAATTWTKPGTTRADLDQDMLQCRYQVELAMAGSAGAVPPTLADAIVGGMNKGLKHNELTSLCMQTRGWAKAT